MKTGSSSTPKPQVRPCNGCGLGVFQGRLNGVLSNVTVRNTSAEIFFRSRDSDGMAATGVVAAAMGLSGAAAGMAAMSMDEMKEPVCQVSFDIDGKHVEAVLWNWPFKNGDEVQVVVEPAPNGGYTGFAVLDPKDRVIVLYPHVSAGRKGRSEQPIKPLKFQLLAFQ
nr:putative type VI secretion system effector [Xanthomonas oryzae]